MTDIERRISRLPGGEPPKSSYRERTRSPLNRLEGRGEVYGRTRNRGDAVTDVGPETEMYDDKKN